MLWKYIGWRMSRAKFLVFIQYHNHIHLASLYQQESFTLYHHTPPYHLQAINNHTTFNMSSTTTYAPTSTLVSSPPSYDTVVDLSSYARTMHQHTKMQMEAASKMARRRSGGAGGNGKLTERESAGRGSISSVDSARS